MGKAGFVFRPEMDSDDRAACVYCEYGLDGWESSDDPMEEHQKRSPDCIFFHPNDWFGLKKAPKEKTKV